MVLSAASLTGEFLSTFVLVFSVASNIICKTPSAWATISTAFAYLAMTAVTSAHMNPAITIATALVKKFPWSAAGGYLVMQFCGAVMGSGAARVLFQDAATVMPQAYVKDAHFFGPVTFAWWQVMLAEVLFTAMLVFVVLNVRFTRNALELGVSQFGFLAIALAVLAAGSATAPISGGVLNPAISLGINLVSLETQAVLQGFAYTIYEILGAMLGAVLFLAVRPEERNQPVSGIAPEPKLSTQLAAEFIGTFMVVLTFGLSVMGRSPITALAVAAATASMLCSVVDVSGGLFNPAVTLAVVGGAKTHGLTLWDGIGYVVFQASAGILAGVLYSGMYDSASFALRPKEPYKVGAAYLLEAVFTSLIAIVYLSTVMAQRTSATRDKYFSMAVFGSLVVGITASGPVSGACLNPAITLGIGIADALNFGSFYYIAIYFVWQVVGGLVGASVFLMANPGKSVDGKAALSPEPREVRH